MKKLLQTVFTILFISSFSIAQEIPNAGFETWTNGNPDNWITDNIQAIPPFFPGVTPVTQSDDEYSGSSSVKLEIVDYEGEPYYPYVYSFSPATQKYGSLTGFYKFAPQSNAHVLTIDVWLFQGSYISGTVGFGEFETYAPASAFTQFTVPIGFDFPTTDQPDSAWIWIIIDDTSENPTTGAYAIIDDLSWGAVVDVNEISSNIPGNFELNQNYPNPFNPSTVLEFSLPEESFVELKVFDILGKEVETLAQDVYPAGTYKADFIARNLPSGIYIAKLNSLSVSGTGKFQKSMKMTLIK